jgi:hypothetical protein
LPDGSPLIDPLEIDNAAEYAGTFTASDCFKLRITAQGKRLQLESEHDNIPLELASGDTFVSTIPGKFARYPIQFGREQPSEIKANTPATNSSKPPIVEIQYGPAFFIAAASDGPKTFAAPAELIACTGHYRSDSAWGGDARVFLQKGKLTFESTPMTLIGENLFRVGEDPWRPITAEFHFLVDGKARLLVLAGESFNRIEVD